MNSEMRSYLATIGQRGGKKSRRTLDPETARAMVRVREARRLYKRYHATCFWSYDPNYKVQQSDLSWVAEQLEKHGDRAAWVAAGRLRP